MACRPVATAAPPWPARPGARPSSRLPPALAPRLAQAAAPTASAQRAAPPPCRRTPCIQSPRRPAAGTLLPRPVTWYSRLPKLIVKFLKSTFAREKLVGVHGYRLSVETLRKWMVAEGVWRAKARRAARVHRSRPRRECVGDLVQIDGSPHDCFEGRGPVCTDRSPDTVPAPVPGPAIEQRRRWRCSAAYRDAPMPDRPCPAAGGVAPAP